VLGGNANGEKDAEYGDGVGSDFDEENDEGVALVEELDEELNISQFSVGVSEELELWAGGVAQFPITKFMSGQVLYKIKCYKVEYYARKKFIVSAIEKQ
jgi:hypothetical protein